MGQCQTLVLPVYMDDMLPMGNKVPVNNFKNFLPQLFKVLAIGDASFFLSLHIEWIRGESLWINQHAFINVILEHFEVPESRFVKTPLTTTENLIPNPEPFDEENIQNQHMYI